MNQRDAKVVMDVTRLAEKQAQDNLRSNAKRLSPRAAKRIQEEVQGLRSSRYHN